MTRRMKILHAALASVLFCAASSARADITGTMDATITLDTGCLINDDNTADGASGADFGTLDFGNQTTLFDEASAQVQGTGAGIVIQCTAGVTPTLTFNAGLHDGQGAGVGLRAMQHGTTTTEYISYDLLQADNATVIAIGGTIELEDDGSVQTVTVNGRAYGADGLISGTYADTVTVVLEL